MSNVTINTVQANRVSDKTMPDKTMPSNTAQTDKTQQATIPISLAYAPAATEQVYVELQVAQGTQIYQALQQAGWLAQYPELEQWCEVQRDATEIDNKQWFVGVFSQKKLLSYELQAHDRVEVYRPLTIDPMRKRKRRADSQ